MWFLKKKKDTAAKNTVYVSIDGASIGVALYQSGTCLYSDRRIHIEGETLRPIKELLRDAFYALKHQNAKIVTEVTVILESPWVKEISVSAKEKRQRPFQVTEKLVEELITKDGKTPEDPNFGVPLGYILENIKLNGYAYSEPVGKITDEIEIIFTKFFGDTDIVKIIDDTIKIFWNRSHIRYLSGAESVFRIGKELGATNDMYISLGSTDTVLRLYSQGMIMEKVTIPFGFQHFLKNLSLAWNTTSKEAIHWVDLFLDKSLSQPEMQRIETDIRAAAKELFEDFDSASKKTATISLERPISILGGDETWNKLMGTMLKEKYFGPIFPHIENTPVYNLCQKIPNANGDKLIALCACTLEGIK